MPEPDKKALFAHLQRELFMKTTKTVAAGIAVSMMSALLFHVEKITEPPPEISGDLQDTDTIHAKENTVETSAFLKNK